MDKLINLFPTNSTIHSIFFLVKSTIVWCIEQNAEVLPVDKVVRPVINQDIASHHLFVVGNDNVVGVQERKQLQDTLDFYTASAIVGRCDHV